MLTTRVCPCNQFLQSDVKKRREVIPTKYLSKLPCKEYEGKLNTLLHTALVAQEQKEATTTHVTSHNAK